MLDEQTSFKQENLDKTKIRNHKIIMTSVIGIFTNILLAAFKAVIGLISKETLI